jgi:hypothetical protein
VRPSGEDQTHTNIYGFQIDGDILIHAPIGQPEHRLADSATKAVICDNSRIHYLSHQYALHFHIKIDYAWAKVKLFVGRNDGGKSKPDTSLRRHIKIGSG